MLEFHDTNSISVHFIWIRWRCFDPVTNVSRGIEIKNSWKFHILRAMPCLGFTILIVQNNQVYLEACKQRCSLDERAGHLFRGGLKMIKLKKVHTKRIRTILFLSNKFNQAYKKQCSLLHDFSMLRHRKNLHDEDVELFVYFCRGLLCRSV